MMTSARSVLFVGASLAVFLGSGSVKAQGVGNAPPQAAGGAGPAQRTPVVDTLQSINNEYNTQLIQLEKQRLERLARLAASQSPEEAARTYESLFRLAIANNLFVEAEPAADRVLLSGPVRSPAVRFLAETINLIATADRGDYDGSLTELRRLVGVRAAGAAGTPPESVLDTPALLTICGAYYQRLIQGERFDVARKAFELISRESTNPDVKDYSSHRLRQLELVGKAAPPIQGRDVDGKPFDMARLHGDVVLVYFWASWCLPNAAEIAWLDEVYSENRDRGFRIVGVNVDTLQNGGKKADEVLPTVRRYLLDHNVRWTNLINGQGPGDYAAAYGVIEIPANFLIDREGKIVHLDLSRKNLAQVVARAVAK